MAPGGTPFWHSVGRNCGTRKGAGEAPFCDFGTGRGAEEVLFWSPEGRYSGAPIRVRRDAKGTPMRAQRGARGAPIRARRGARGAPIYSARMGAKGAPKGRFIKFE